MRPGDQARQSDRLSSGAKVSLVHIVEPMAMAFGGDVPMDLSQLQQQQFDQAKAHGPPVQQIPGHQPAIRT
jgi:hypothetical protein